MSYVLLILNDRGFDMTLTDNAKTFLSKGPTLISSCAGFKFYECPTYGDEVPLKVITPDGNLKRTPFWESPSLEDVCDEYGMTLVRA